MTTCSWCYEKGHRVTTCEDYFSHLDKTVQYYGDDKRLTPKERKHYKAFIAKKEGRKVNESRQCSFCGSQGHNLRTCKQNQAVKEDYKAINKAFRVILENGLKGFGPGALIQGYRRDRAKPSRVLWSWTGMVDKLDPHALTFGHFVSSGFVFDYSNAMTAIKMADKWHEDRSNIYYNPLADSPAGHITKVSIPFSDIYNASYEEEAHLMEVDNAAGRKVIIDCRKEATSTAWSDLCHWGGGVVSGVTGAIEHVHCHSATTVHLASPGSDISLSDRDAEEGWSQFMERVKGLYKKNRKNQDMICYATKLLLVMSTIIPRKYADLVPERYRRCRAYAREWAELEWARPRGYLTNYNTQCYLDVVHEYDKWYADIQRSER